jgi:hypothetical protein
LKLIISLALARGKFLKVHNDAQLKSFAGIGTMDKTRSRNDFVKESKKESMKTEELQKYIQNLSPELYSFAYVLIPDDLQASQLMIDCVQSFLIQKKPLVEKMALTKNKIVRNLLEETRFHLMKIVFELSRKRYKQLKVSFYAVEHSGGFFSLDFDEKAVLYLKEKANLDLDQIEFITGAIRAEILAYLYSARIKMTELMPDQQFPNSNLGSGGVA